MQLSVCKMRSPPPRSCPAGKSLNSTSFLSEQELGDGVDRTAQERSAPGVYTCSWSKERCMEGGDPTAGST